MQRKERYFLIAKQTQLITFHFRRLDDVIYCSFCRCVLSYHMFSTLRSVMQSLFLANTLLFDEFLFPYNFIKWRGWSIFIHADVFLLPQFYSVSPQGSTLRNSWTFLWEGEVLWQAVFLDFFPIFFHFGLVRWWFGFSFNYSKTCCLMKIQKPLILIHKLSLPLDANLKKVSGTPFFQA